MFSKQTEQFYKKKQTNKKKVSEYTSAGKIDSHESSNALNSKLLMLTLLFRLFLVAWRDQFNYILL